jgi:hypothetical protein
VRKELAARDVAIAAVACHENVMEALRRYEIGVDTGIYPSVDAAMAAVQ